MKRFGLGVGLALALGCVAAQAEPAAPSEATGDEGVCALELTMTYDGRETVARVLAEEGRQVDWTWSAEEARLLAVAAGGAAANADGCTVAVVSEAGTVLAGPFAAPQAGDAVAHAFSINERAFELVIRPE